MMQKTRLLSVVLLMLMGLVAKEALAEDASATATIRITFSVGPIDVIGIDPIEPINPGETGETDLRWTTNGDDRKVFVQVDHVPESLKSLRVKANGFWGEYYRQRPVGVGEVILDNTKKHELTSTFGRAVGGCLVLYTAEVDSRATMESEVVEVSYILTTSDGSVLNVSTHQLVIEGLPIQKEEAQQEDGTPSKGEVIYITITD